MAARNLADVVTAELNGQTRQSEWVKNVTQATTQGVWYDLTGSAGNPKAKQWFDAAPLVAQQIKQSTDGGIFHGSNVAGDGYEKYLREMRVACASATPLPMTLTLCDYLLYYPSIEDGNADLQELDNTLTLPRYADGKGVEAIAVTISSRTGGQSFNINYTNSDGVAGRVSPAVIQNAAAAPGSVTTSAVAANSGGNPFLPMQENDAGIRSIQSVQMLGPDTGFFALVLVKPLASIMVRGIDAPYVKDFIIYATELTRIYDDAFLGLLAQPNGSLSGLAVRGNLKSVWV
jgi:hypothetical protein